MKKYKIEIYEYKSITKIYKSDDIKEILSWYKSNWQFNYELGNVSFEVYYNDIKLNFDEIYKLGFFD